MYLTQIDRSETDKTKLKKDGGKLNTRKNPMLDLGDKMFRFPKKESYCIVQILVNVLSEG